MKLDHSLYVAATAASVVLSTAMCAANAGHSDSATMLAAPASAAETQQASLPAAALSGRPVTVHVTKATFLAAHAAAQRRAQSGETVAWLTMTAGGCWQPSASSTAAVRDSSPISIHSTVSQLSKRKRSDGATRAPAACSGIALASLRFHTVSTPSQ